MIDRTTNTTDATRGQELSTRVAARKRELEGAVAKLPVTDAVRRDLERVLTQIQGLLSGDLDNFPHVVAAQLNAWLEASKHLDEHHAPDQPPRRGYVGNLEDATTQNSDFRRVLYTAPHSQLVVMTLEPSSELGEEIHDGDQFLRIEKGFGVAILEGVRTPIRAGFAVLVPAGTRHNIVNTGRGPLMFYTLYAPPHHRDGVVHRTREDAEKDHEHFDGKTTTTRTT